MERGGKAMFPFLVDPNTGEGSQQGHMAIGLHRLPRDARSPQIRLPSDFLSDIRI